LAAIELTEKKSQVCWDARENPKRGILSLLPARLRTTERDHSERMLASPAFSPQEKKKTRERGERLFSNPICTYARIKRDALLVAAKVAVPVLNKGRTSRFSGLSSYPYLSVMGTSTTFVELTELMWT